MTVAASYFLIIGPSCRQSDCLSGDSATLPKRPVFTSWMSPARGSSRPRLCDHVSVTHIVKVHGRPGKLVLGHDGARGRANRPRKWFERRIGGIGSADPRQPADHEFLILGELVSPARRRWRHQRPIAVVAHAVHDLAPVS